MQWDFPLLSALIWFPIIGALLIFLVGGAKQPNRARWLAMVVSVICLGLCIPLWQHFDIETTQFQFLEEHRWFPLLHIKYALGVDGFAMPLIVLTCLLTPLVVISAWQVITTRVAHYMAAFLI